MKKMFITFCLILTPVLFVPAADFQMSAGGGALFSAGFQSFTLTDSAKKEWQEWADIYNCPQPLVDMYSQDKTINSLAGGFFVFFDATYAELSINMLFGTRNATLDPIGFQFYSPAPTAGSSTIQMGFSLLGKYPFELNPKITLFPALGIEYRLLLLEKDVYNRDVHRKDAESYLKDTWDNDIDSTLTARYDGTDNMGWNELIINVGVGADFSFSDKLYFRAEALYGVNILKVQIKDVYRTDPPNPVVVPLEIYNAGISHGPTIKIGVGYKFFGAGHNFFGVKG
ncbi:hypothetical protein FACS1894190_12790 [Spirochaetia bacterium]|nr:hypothetical protein FACS1894190_12790 [Spirochaetia bacterium]GHV22049.1 hypothetical protein FACS189494_08310 [Spirochaetia bacterium]